MQKNMKDVFKKTFNKDDNYDQILNIINATNKELHIVKPKKIPKYAIAMGLSAGAITIAYVVGKKIFNNKSLKLEMN